MPLRLHLLTKRWSSLDLPILPFLAPRVFQPWPCKRRRVHSVTPRAVQQRAGFVKEGVKDLSHKRDKVQGQYVDSMGQMQWHKIEKPEDVPNFARSVSNDADDEQNRLRRVEEYQERNVDDRSSSLDSSGVFAEEKFRRKYEEIWGPRIKKQPPMPVRRVQNNPKRSEAGKPLRRQTIKITYVVPSKRVSERPRKRRSQVRERAVQRWMNRKRAFSASVRKKLHYKAQEQADRENIPFVRPKWARYKPYADVDIYAPFRLWHKKFAALNLRHELFMRGRRLPIRRIGFQATPRFTTTFLKELMDEKSRAVLRLRWESFSPKTKMKIWPELMLTTLQSRPDKVLNFISGTYAQEPFPPPYALSDCLNYVISCFLGRGHDPTKSLVRLLYNYIFRLLRIGPKDYLHISQESTFLLLSHAADLYSLEKLYRMLTDLNHPLHQNTLMHFASRLAKAGDTETALEILQKLRGYGSDFNTPKMLSLCSTVLDRSNRSTETAHSDSDIFELMIGWGMNPNIITYNVLMKNS